MKTLYELHANNKLITKKVDEGGAVVIVDTKEYYGLPKIQKPGIPLTLIVSSRSWSVYELSKYLLPLPHSSMVKAIVYFNNSKHFIPLIKDLALEECDLMVSFTSFQFKE